MFPIWNEEEFAKLQKGFVKPNLNIFGFFCINYTIIDSFFYMYIPLLVNTSVAVLAQKTSQSTVLLPSQIPMGKLAATRSRI